MSATTKYYVAVSLQGRTQFYVRDTERMISKRWTAVPTFTPELSQAIAMLEPFALALVRRLRFLKEDPWLQSLEGQRVTPPEEGQSQHIEDTRQEVRATLGEENDPAAKWYRVRPARTPNGPKWVINYNLPNRPSGQDQIYRDSPIECLERAQEMGVLEYADPAPVPVSKPVVQKFVGPRVRPGDCR